VNQRREPAGISAAELAHVARRQAKSLNLLTAKELQRWLVANQFAVETRLVPTRLGWAIGKAFGPLEGA